jgi:CelD/BcsL family acetyltransferase involved in cellulose biosynthesis
VDRDTDRTPSPSGLRVEVVRDLARFEELATGWDELVPATPRPSPFMLHAWLAAWWAEQGAEREFHVVTVFRGDALVGALPLEISSRGPIRVARVPGPPMALSDLLARPHDADAVCDAIVRAIDALPLHVVDIDGVAAESLLATVLGRHGRVRTAPGLVAPTLAMPDGFDAAWRAATSSKTRNTQSRRFRQLSDTGEATWSLHSTPETVAAALPDAYRLHHLRWEGRRDAVGYEDLSPFGRAELRPFHLRALTGMAGGGHVRLLELRLDGVPIAFHLYLLVGTTVVVYRLAFDPDFSRFSPGLLTTLEALRRASDEGATSVEFLRGVERYKMELADRADPLVRVTGLARTPRGSLFAAGAIGTTRLRSRLRQSARVRGMVRRARTTVARLRPGRARA